MKNKKKFSIFALLAFALVLSSCGNNLSNDQSLNSSDSTTSVSTSTSSNDESSTSTPVSSNSESTSSEELIKATSLNIDFEQVEIAEGETKTISVSILPENATNKDYHFVVDNPSVASISDNGEILGIKEGNTSIHAILDDDDTIADIVIVNVYHKYSITVDAPTGVTVTVDSYAKADDLVYVDLSYDSNALTIDNVLANDIELGTESGHYYFYMPNEDVIIKVTASPTINYYKVISKQNAVNLITTGAYKEGDNVEIGFTLLPGYQFNGSVIVYKNINAFDPNDRIAITSSVINGIIKFTMPNEDVEIVLDIESSTFSVTKIDEYSHISSLEVNDKYVSPTNGVYDIKYGESVKVIFVPDSSDYCSKAKPNALYIPEMDLTLNIESQTASFTMPYYNITIEVLFTPVYRNISLNGSEHISLSAYSYEEGNYTLIENSQAIYGDKVYLKATPIDESRYQVRSIIGKYYEEGKTYTYDLAIELENDGYYSFTMPKSDLSKYVEISITEKDISKFINQPFVGSYLGIELYSSKTSVEAFQSYKKATIDSSGIIAQGLSSITEINIKSYDSENNLLIVENDDNQTGIAYYKDNLFASHWKYNSSSLITDDMVFLIKKQNIEDDDSMYSINAVYLDSTCYLAQVYYNNALYFTFVADINNQSILLNPTFNFTSGTNVTDSDANYIVSVNDTLMYSVINKTTLCRYDGLQGTYTNNDSTLVLDGIGNATYEGDSSYTYEVKENNEITLIKSLESGRRIITISVNGNSYTIVSDEIEEYSPLYTRNFYGTTSYDFYIHISFDRTDKCKVYVLGDPNTTSIPSSATFGYDWNATYTYDAETMTVVIQTASNGTAKLTLSGEAGSYSLQCKESSMTFYGGSLPVGRSLQEFVI